MSEQFPSNAHRPPGGPKPEPVESPTLEAIATSATIRKKSLGRRFAETFFSGSAGSASVLGYLAKEVIVPALQDMVIGAVTQGFERAIYGESRTPYRAAQRGIGRTYTPYNRPTTVITSSTDMVPARQMATIQSSTDLREFVVDSHVEAEAIVDKMYETLQRYQAVTVANYYQLMNQTPVTTDHRFGWTNLDTLRIARHGGMYHIIMPPPIDLR